MQKRGVALRFASLAAEAHIFGFLRYAFLSFCFQSEIFDMVSPAVPGKITLSDLISSKCGHTVISILIDVNGFWKYDNRENLMHSEAAEEE